MRRTPILIAVVALVSLAALAAAQEYDLVILNGRVMDPESGFDGIRNVGVKDGHITTITEDEITGERTLDASGHVVAPGFIDSHWHGIDPFSMRMALRDGVTTALEMETGVRDIEHFFAQRKGYWRLNYGVTVSHLGARVKVLDDVTYQDVLSQPQALADAAEDGERSWADRVPTEEQRREILAILDEGLKKGALGIGSPLDQISDGVTATELFEVQELAGSYGRVTAVRPRPGAGTQGLIGGVQEALANALLLEAPVVIQPCNDPGWELATRMIEKARERGLVAWCAINPYRSIMASAGAEWLGPEKLAEASLTPEENVLSPLTGEFVTAAELAALREESPEQDVFVFARPEAPETWVALENVPVASDGDPGFRANGKLVGEGMPFSEFVGHPRASGSYGKALRLAREHEIPLMSVLANLSYWPARHLGDAGIEQMRSRGRLQEGMVADITVFDPETVTDHSAPEVGKYGLPTTGIPYVIVYGTPTIEQSLITLDAHSGQEIRAAVAD